MVAVAAAAAKAKAAQEKLMKAGKKMVEQSSAAAAAATKEAIKQGTGAASQVGMMGVLMSYYAYVNGSLSSRSTVKPNQPTLNTIERVCR